MKRAVVGIVAALALGAACQGDFVTKPSPAAAVLEDRTPRLVLTTRGDALPHHPYWFESSALDGDKLTVTVRYAGGCKTHTFALVVSPAFEATTPRTLRGSLAHDSNGDPCRGIETRTMTFDLSPIREVWRATYGDEPGLAQIIIATWPSPIIYGFQP